jgi:hypothetical protein
MACPCGCKLASARTWRVRADASQRPHGHCVSAQTHSYPPLPSPSTLPYKCSLLSARTSANAHARKKIKIKIIFNFFGRCYPLEKREKNFGFQSPRSPSSAGFAGEATRRRKFFQPSSPSHPSKLYSSLGLLNSKVPKPFSPFSLRLIHVDGF